MKIKEVYIIGCEQILITIGRMKKKLKKKHLLIKANTCFNKIS